MRNCSFCLLAFIASLILINGCGVSVNPVGRISIFQDSTTINSDEEEFDLGKILIGETSPEFVFTISNGGKSILELLGEPNPVSITDVSSCFDLDQSSMLKVLKSREKTSFSIKFTPFEEGIKSSIITINSSDEDIPQFTFTVIAEGVTPEININQNGVDILTTSGEFDFGKTLVGSLSSEVTFTIQNTGTGKLELTGESELISISGSDASNFAINQIDTKSSVDADDFTTFTVTFTPDGIRGKYAMISIANSDLDENPYTFNLIGEGITPTEINIKQDITNIPSGKGEYEFGQIDVGDSSNDIVFTVENLGTTELFLNGLPKIIEISGTDFAMFTIDDSNTERSVAFQNSTTFSIQFTPTSHGMKSATISISNNDADENPYTFTIKGVGLASEMSIMDTQMQNIPNGTGNFDFGDLFVTTNTASSFTIQNNGNTDLNLTNTPMIEITGNGANAFTVKTQPSSPISAGTNTSFEIEFAPLASQQYSATITIANNDPYNNPYTFTVSGKGIEPEIEILNSSNQSIQSGTGVFDYSGIMINTSKTETFTIKNQGTANLILSGNPNVSITGAGASAFSVTAQPSSPVTPASDTSFTIKFAPVIDQKYLATISIANNDLDENPYTFTISGTGLAPEINIVDSGSNSIVSGSGGFNYNGIEVNSTKEETFTVQNTGTGELKLTGTPVISITGSGASAYSVTSQPNSTVAANSDTTFKIKFSPTADQVYKATVSIANTDSDENPYTFTLEGTGLVPEINIVDSGSNSIASGSGSFTFQSITVNTSKEETFTIQNTGLGKLQLTGNPVISISGSGASAYSVTAQPNSTVAANSDTTYKIKFSPALGQLYEATVTIANTDSDENPYTFALKGTGLLPEINIVDSGSNSIASGSGSFTYQSTSVNTSNEEVFTIQNIGLGELQLTGNPVISISGSGASAYSVAAQPNSTVAANSDTTFKIKFTPTLGQLYEANVSIANTDSDEDPYTFAIKGTGLLPEINIVDSGSNSIASGSGSFDYQTIAANTSKEETFTIQNTGLGELQLSGSPFVTITGTGASAYSVTTQPTSPISANSSTSFKIKFTPTLGQLYEATVSIANTDSDENPYTFNLEGTGLVQNITFDFNGDGFEDVVIGAEYDNEGGTYAGAAYIYLGKSSSNSNLTTADATIKIIGETASDMLGCSVAGIGDFNKDGFDDVLIGAYRNSEGGRNAGAAYIFFGSASPATKMYASSCDVKYVGYAMGDSFGRGVSSAGDFNNDGYVDVLISAMFNNDIGGDAGAVYVFYGGIHPPSKLHANKADIVITGESAFDLFGFTVSRAGDFNNDGIDDILVGCYGNDEGGGDAGCMYLFFGSSNPSSSISASNADIKIVNTGALHLMTCSYAGDFNNDNISDIMYSGVSKTLRKGSVYIYYGRSNPSKKLDTSDANLEIKSSSDNSNFGSSLNYVGDINNDGIADIVVNDNNYNIVTGRVYVFFGKSNPSSTMDTSNADITITGEKSGDRLGACITSIGDFNNDGIKDFALGSYYFDNGTVYDGVVYIFYGKSNHSSSMSALSANIKIVGNNTIKFGVSVSGSQ